ncbi:rhomboid family intramembrane serine protease GlpG [Photorhabdus temperata]|uniref:Rhomboid protease GlpG n=2 Tax=Photorhabdus temperata TaxID=574560 RepID=A0A081RVM9_PHOTE|nr:rhomboid family intramembrane serine protease GlpG [Photorhabdus temperata]EQC01429.1 intramembrane serine protease GlpG [Photorhabdus temperata subsp. temperata M1021]ERT13473.1 intramembrane serine protease GlpG [Photorhabdus temperata J3]KER02732.1 rhomboid family protease GlpG [Photorhabdus temperata subsp. temperata Meg1]
MIHVIAISNPRLAQAFIDYMATHQVHLTMRPGHDGQHVELWLEDDTKLTIVQQELEQFTRDPLNERYQAASWQSGDVNHSLKYHNNLNWQYLSRQAGPLTMTVLILNIAVYLWMQFSGDYQVMSWLAWPDNSQHLELWRWVTHGLLHFSLLHIIFNLMWWWYLGGQTEKRLGTGKLFVITIVSAVFSGWGQSLFSGSHFGGLSGVVYALISYVWLTGERAPERGIGVPRGLMAFSILWLIIGYFDTFGLAIANAAHFSGLIIGLLMALWDNRHTFKNNTHNRHF